MPTYEYVCDACGHAFEQFQSITAPAVKKCPACAKLKVRRLIGTGAGIIFKGSGFYQTDYRSGDYKAAASKERGSSGESKTPAAASESSAKSESGSAAAKPASKPETKKTSKASAAD